MRLLLDTHVAIWSVAATGRLPAALVEIMQDNAGDTYVSAASLWEIAIKRAKSRRDQMPFDAEVALRHFEEAGHQLLDIRPRDAVAVSALARLHSDPFDRLLVAQAMTEGMKMLTMDRTLVGYGEVVLVY